MTVRIVALVASVLLLACGPSASEGDGGAGGVDATADAISGGCIEGVRRCTGTTLETCTNDVWATTEECPTACDNQLGCVVCQPGTGTCNGSTSTACLDDGSGYEDVYCDPDQGMTCNEPTGVCEGVCAPKNLGRSYIGCEYFPTTTAQLVSPSFAFAITVSNTGNVPATITIVGGILTAPIVFDVQPQQVGVQTLPWVPQLKMCNVANPFGCTATDPWVVNQVVDGAYHLQSTQPVTVYQFSPKDYAGVNEFSYSNDASLLIPTNAMTGNYLVAAWGFFAQYGYPGLMAVTAVRDGTSVTITPKAASAGTPSFPVGVPTTITLDQGDVVQIPNTSGDLTGSVVAADKPVQVIAGHYCTNVPLTIPYCDHIEESMFPTETLSTEYIITAPALPAIPTGKEEMIRVVATQANTTLTYDPPLVTAPASIANAGDFIEIPRQVGDYTISANQKILVAQYMEGQDAGGGTGDPAMTLAVAIDQYRTSYLFHAPTNYETNYVNVTAPNGAVVSVDGVDVAGWVPIGASGYSVARVALTNGLAADGNHQAISADPFGVSVYGYGQYTSYWYPGGLDLANIPIE